MSFNWKTAWSRIFHQESRQLFQGYRTVNKGLSSLFLFPSIRSQIIFQSSKHWHSSEASYDHLILPIVTKHHPPSNPDRLWDPHSLPLSLFHTLQTITPSGNAIANFTSISLVKNLIISWPDSFNLFSYPIYFPLCHQKLWHFLIFCYVITSK